MTANTIALAVENVHHRYGQHPALQALDLEVAAGEVFTLLGPNGSGKTTLFRLISTLTPVQQGDIQVFGHCVRRQRNAVRSMLGVVFQSPSLDPKLTVWENIRCQAALYGLRGSELAKRIEEVSHQLGIHDRRDTHTEALSGGLKRRVELAKSILHRPQLLLMDEPSTGLDPASRLDLWHVLKTLQASCGVTVVMTTHLLEEADKADRIAIMDSGRTVAVGQPAELRKALGEQVLNIHTQEPSNVLKWLEERSVEAQSVEQHIRVVGAEAATIVAPLSSEFGERIQTLVLGQPSLEDVFVARTGHRFWGEEVKPVNEKKKRRG